MENYSYLSICMQSLGVGRRIETLRRYMPFSMGSLYWQFNDLWPVFSWSSVDYYGQWKALHYEAKRLYRNVMVSIRNVGGSFDSMVEGANYIDFRNFTKQMDGSKVEFKESHPNVEEEGGAKLPLNQE